MIFEFNFYIIKSFGEMDLWSKFSANLLLIFGLLLA